MEMIYQVVRRNAMQAYMKSKAYNDKKVNASKLKEADYVYALHPKADHQRSNFTLPEFRWFGPYILGIIFTKKQLSGAQTWRQQDASASSHANASVHILTTPIRIIDPAKRMET